LCRFLLIIFLFCFSRHAHLIIITHHHHSSSSARPLIMHACMHAQLLYTDGTTQHSNEWRYDIRPSLQLPLLWSLRGTWPKRHGNDKYFCSNTKTNDDLCVPSAPSSSSLLEKGRMLALHLPI
jgi:hypothetical protein